MIRILACLFGVFLAGAVAVPALAAGPAVPLHAGTGFTGDLPTVPVAPYIVEEGGLTLRAGIGPVLTTSTPCLAAADGGVLRFAGGVPVSC